MGTTMGTTWVCPKCGKKLTSKKAAEQHIKRCNGSTPPEQPRVNVPKQPTNTQSPQAQV